MSQAKESQPLRISFRGVNFEDPSQKRWAYEISKPAFNFFMGLGDASVSGSLPASGPGLVVMNHISSNDVFVAHGLPIATAKRTLRLVARRSLIDLTVQDTQKAKERRNIDDDRDKDYSQLGLKGKIKRKLETYYMSKFDTIMTDIGGQSSREFFAEVMRELMGDHLVGMFFQGTRRPRLDLLDDLDGAAILVTRYLSRASRAGKEIPVYPVGISGTNGHAFRGVEVNIGEPFYSRDVPRIAGVSRIETARNLIRNRVGELVADPKMKAAWELSQRGMSREEIEQVYLRNPDLVSAVELLKLTSDLDRRPPPRILEEIDSIRF